MKAESENPPVLKEEHWYTLSRVATAGGPKDALLTYRVKILAAHTNGGHSYVAIDESGEKFDLHLEFYAGSDQAPGHAHWGARIRPTLQTSGPSQHFSNIKAES